jgi:hypothetical protein
MLDEGEDYIIFRLEKEVYHVSSFATPSFAFFLRITAI